MRPKKGIAVAFLATVLMVGACGGNGKKTSGGATSTTASGGTGGKIAISMSSAGKPATYTDLPVDESKLECKTKAPDPKRGITATSIKVGGLLTLSNAGTSVYNDSIKGAKARFERENASGGVFGRKIDFIGAQDDASNAQQNADAGRKLAENEKVFAVAPIATAFSNYADVLCKDVVPAIGWAFNSGLCLRYNTFGFTGCLLPEGSYTRLFAASVHVQLLKDGADKSVVLLGLDNASAKNGITNTKHAFEAAGLKVVMADSRLVPGTPPSDVSPLVHEILTSNHGKPPAMVYHVTDFTNVTTVTGALKAAGYKGKQISAVGYDPRLKSLKALDGSYSYLQWLPYEATDNPTVRQMTADLQRYGQGTTLGLVSALGWLSADMLIDGLKATGPDLTVDKFLSTVNSNTFHYGDGIFIGRTSWPEDHFYGPPCGSAAYLAGGKYTVALPLSCNDSLNF